MKSLKLKQFAFSLLAVLSLFVSAVSACDCSHHQAKQETEAPASCHEHSIKTEQSSDVDATQTNATAISENACVCFQTAPRAFAKAETVKFGKQAAAVAAVSLSAPPAIVFVSPSAQAKIDFIKPFYLSDSFYNLSPGRAPPVL